MDVGEICSRDVYCAGPDQSLAAAVAEMGKRHVGALVVTDPAAGSARPIGIVTDRDAVCGQLTHQADLFCLTVGQVMTPDPLTLLESTDVTSAIRRMSAHTVRRAPVVSAAGDLVGIVSLDDLVPIVAEELNALAVLLGEQARHERDGTSNGP